MILGQGHIDSLKHLNYYFKANKLTLLFSEHSFSPLKIWPTGN